MVNVSSLHTARARAARSAKDHQGASSPVSFQVAATDHDDAEQNRLDGSDFASVHAHSPRAGHATSAAVAGVALDPHRRGRGPNRETVAAPL